MFLLKKVSAMDVLSDKIDSGELIDDAALFDIKISDQHKEDAFEYHMEEQFPNGLDEDDFVEYINGHLYEITEDIGLNMDDDGSEDWVNESGIMLDNPSAPVHKGDFPILKIEVSDDDITSSKLYSYLKELIDKANHDFVSSYENYFDESDGSQDAVNEANDYLVDCAQMAIDNVTYDYPLECAKDVVNGLKKLARKGTTYMDGNFADWSEYYDRKPMKSAKDVLDAAYDSLEALGTYGITYNYGEYLDSEHSSNMEYSDGLDSLSEEAQEMIKERFGID